MRRTTLTLCLALLLPGAAAANEPAQTAFDLLAKQANVSAQTNFIKLDRKLDMSTAMAIDAELSRLYGTPETTRAGLKVWEVGNASASAGQSDVTTIMCGPDGKGGLYISADRRGAVSNRVSTPKATKKRRKALPPQANGRARRAISHAEAQD